jgi:hypothetical protein
MGREQRSRRKLPPETFCYLCGQPIANEQKWNRDHVPPQRIFAKSVRQKHSPQLEWLYTHVECNSAFRDDEDYFVTALVGHHATPWASAVFDDIKRGARKGHGGELIKTIVSQFGKVTGPDGSRVFALDANRAHRAVWKIVRGLYTLETNKFLPDKSWVHIEVVLRSGAEQVLDSHAWYRMVRNTEGLARHKAIFDYKWLCRREQEYRVNLVAMLLWDNLVLLCMFHDPVCRCQRCRGESTELPT